MTEYVLILNITFLTYYQNKYLIYIILVSIFIKYYIFNRIFKKFYYNREI